MNDIKPCIEKINFIDDTNKKLTTLFNDDYFSVLNRTHPKLQKDPNYKPINKFIYPHVRTPSKNY